MAIILWEKITAEVSLIIVQTQTYVAGRIAWSISGYYAKEAQQILLRQ